MKVMESHRKAICLPKSKKGKKMRNWKNNRQGLFYFSCTVYVSLVVLIPYNIHDPPRLVLLPVGMY